MPMHPAGRHGNILGYPDILGMLRHVGQSPQRPKSANYFSASPKGTRWLATGAKSFQKMRYPGGLNGPDG